MSSARGGRHIHRLFVKISRDHGGVKTEEERLSHQQKEPFLFLLLCYFGFGFLECFRTNYFLQLGSARKQATDSKCRCYWIALSTLVRRKREDRGRKTFSHRVVATRKLESFVREGRGPIFSPLAPRALSKIFSSIHLSNAFLLHCYITGAAIVQGGSFGHGVQ